MAWQRSGDTGATYPKLMAVRGDARADERTINEVAGFIWRLSMQSGAHLTDYVIDPGTIEMIGGPRTPELIRLSLKQGLLVRARQAGSFTLIQDPDFIHLRSRAEVERERQQRDDTRDDSLLVVVRRRDGDNCRWCGVEVIWPGRKTKRSGEYDHLRPDHLDQGIPTTADLMVVACRRCNRSRGGNQPEWDSSHALRPAPLAPRYGAWTAQYLTDNGYPTEPTSSDARPAPAPGADPAPDGVRPATGLDDDPALSAGPSSSDARPAPTLAADPAPDGVRPATGLDDDPALSAEATFGTASNLSRYPDSRSDTTGSAGSGRVGSGRVVSGRAGDGSGVGGGGLGGAPPGRSSRGRGRRGRRSKPPSRGDS